MNNQKKTFSFRKRALSFKYAANGILCLLKNEHNAWIHLFALAGVITSGFFFNIKATEWIFVTIASGIVLLAEGFNTAIEYLANEVTLNLKPSIGKIKDIAAGAVLIAAIMAAIVGSIIFLPYIFNCFTQGM